MTLIKTLRTHAETPNVAVVFDDKRWTYAELDDITERIGASFLGLGIRPGDRVALQLSNGPELVFCYYACWKIGAIAVPINNRFAEPEIEYVFGHCKARVCISQADLYRALQSVRGTLTSLERCYLVGDRCGLQDVSGFEELTGSASRIETEANGDPADVAAILYTSGTTSRPKGVAHTRRSLHLTGKYHGEQFGFGPADTTAVMPPMSHILGLMYLLSALHTGGTVLVIPRFEPGPVLETLSQHRATRLAGLPVMLNAMLHHPGSDAYDLSSLTTCLAGGDAVPPSLQEQFEATFGGQLLEGCGMTEVIPYALNTPEEKRVGSIGRPALGVSLRLLGDDGSEVPEGEVGEVAAKSEAAMIGYWEDPQTTAATIQDGWVRTGDLARCDRDGFFWFMGRKKEIIVRGGSNISPQEVEEILYMHAAVREVGVVGVPDPARGEAVWAYVALEFGHSATAEEIRAFAKERIAAYKVPERIEFLEELPKGPTGKVHRKTLRERATS